MSSIFYVITVILLVLAFIANLLSSIPFLIKSKEFHQGCAVSYAISGFIVLIIGLILTVSV